MKYVMFLTLDDTGPNPYIKVEKKSQEVAKNTKAAQKLSWHLSQNAYQGKVHSFRWVDAVPPNTFGPAQPTPAGKRYNMDDYNDTDDSAGDYAYELKVKIGTKIYSTTPPVMTAGASDPTIKNK